MGNTNHRGMPVGDNHRPTPLSQRMPFPSSATLQIAKDRARANAHPDLKLAAGDPDNWDVGAPAPIYTAVEKGGYRATKMRPYTPEVYNPDTGEIGSLPPTFTKLGATVRGRRGAKEFSETGEVDTLSKVEKIKAELAYRKANKKKKNKESDEDWDLADTTEGYWY